MKFFRYILIIFVVQTSFAQQETLFSQYMFNPALFNPAYTGSRGVSSLYMHHRSQWVEMEGAPKTSYVGFQTLLDNQKVGLGFNAITEAVGPIRSTTLNLDWSYHLQLGLVGKLAFGIKGTLDKLDVDLSGINQYQDDAYLYANIDRPFVANFGMGFFYYTDRLFVGGSIPYLFQNKHYDTANFTAEDWSHLYLSAGYVFDLSPQLKFKPTVFYRSVPNIIQQFDISGNFLIQEKVQLGLTYRFDSAYSVMTAFQLSPQVLIGYSYDRETTVLQQFNKGSHELFLRYEFSILNKLKLQSPRFF
jgi:type IX secretion system PorP/SprF family membrane protein